MHKLQSISISWFDKDNFWSGQFELIKMSLPAFGTKILYGRSSQVLQNMIITQWTPAGLLYMHVTPPHIYK